VLALDERIVWNAASVSVPALLIPVERMPEEIG
jgi:hypothetical protein